MSDTTVSLSQPQTYRSPEAREEDLLSQRLEHQQVVASRTFTDNLLKGALAAQESCKDTSEIIKLAYRIEATQEALEKLHQAGLSSPKVTEKLLQSIYVMGQKFLSHHRDLCKKASDEALSLG